MTKIKSNAITHYTIDEENPPILTAVVSSSNAELFKAFFSIYGIGTFRILDMTETKIGELVNNLFSTWGEYNG